MAASFQVEEEGPSHYLPMDDVPPPESVPSSDELLRRFPRSSYAAKIRARAGG